MKYACAVAVHNNYWVQRIQCDKNADVNYLKIAVLQLNKVSDVNTTRLWCTDRTHWVKWGQACVYWWHLLHPGYHLSTDLVPVTDVVNMVLVSLHCEWLTDICGYLWSYWYFQLVTVVVVVTDHYYSKDCTFHCIFPILLQSFSLYV